MAKRVFGSVFRLSEPKIVVGVFLLAALAGWLYLTIFVGAMGHGYSMEPLAFGPSALWACGHGLSAYVASDTSPIEAFLAQKTMTLDMGHLGPMLIFPAPGKFTNDRLYLLYAVGITWWLLGVSWPALNVFLAIVYGTIAVLIYGIFRLGMRRLISLGGALFSIASPMMLGQMPSIRDYCKAPFILATILVVGYLISRRIRLRSFFLTALALGLVIGVGVGFRQDSIICVPPALFVMAFFARGEKPFPVMARLAALLLFGAAFLVPAWPVLRMNKDTGGNNAFYLVQGFSRQSLDDLDLEPASYTPVATVSDCIVHATICAFNRRYPEPRAAASQEYIREWNSVCFVHAALRGMANPFAALPWLALEYYPGFVHDLCEVDIFPSLSGNIPETSTNGCLGIWTKEAELVARRYAANLAMTFPADVVSRWYAATTRVTHGLLSGNPLVSHVPNAALATLSAIEKPVADHLKQYGDFYALAALLLLSARRVWLGLAALGLILYFCGYTSLSFQPRHAFHLEFIPLWLMGFLLERALRAIMIMGRKSARHEVFPDGKSFVKFLFRSFGRMAVFSVVSVCLLAAPLLAARFVQHRNLNVLVEQYRHARLEPIPAKGEPEPDGKICYRPLRIPGFETHSLPFNGLWAAMGMPVKGPRDVGIEYLAAEFEVTNDMPNLLVEYENIDAFFNNYEYYMLSHSAAPRTIRCFFPIFDITRRALGLYDHDATLTSFKGITVPAGMRLKALYRVENIRDFPILMNLWLVDPESAPAEGQPFQWRRRIHAFGLTI